MKHIFHNEVFSIRKLKVGTCSVLLAISILGSNSILADEIGTNTSQIDTKEISYLGWNDNSSNRKYIVYKNLDDKFEGIYGEISPNKVKGFCKICNQESDTSLFLNKTKHNKSSGTYTKKGDYICYDSFKCNQNLNKIDPNSPDL